MAKEKTQQVVAQAGDLRNLLLQYREKAGFSAVEMAAALCLSEESILRLENEEFQLLAEPPYVRGYIRNYAKQADADDKEAIRLYETLRGANPDELDYHIKVSPSMHKSSKRVSPILSQLFLLLLLLAGLVGLFMIPAVNQWVTTTWNNFSKQAGEQYSNAADKPSLTGSMPVPLPLNNQTDSVSTEVNTVKNIVKTETEEKKESVATEDSTPSPEKPNKTIVEKSKKEEQANPGKEEKIKEPAQPEVSEKEIKIKMLYTKDVWMRIKGKNNKTVYEGQTAAGQERNLTLEKPLTFRVGNAQGLSLFVNDKPVDISQYIKGSIANFTLE